MNVRGCSKTLLLVFLIYSLSVQNFANAVKSVIDRWKASNKLGFPISSPTLIGLRARCERGNTESPVHIYSATALENTKFT